MSSFATRSPRSATFAALLILLSGCGDGSKAPPAGDHAGSASPASVPVPPPGPAPGAGTVTMRDPSELPLRDSVPIPSLELPPQGSGTPVTLGLDDLRRKLLEGNTSVLLSANRVHQAKEHVNIARGNLLPAINLSGLLSLGAGGGFSLTSIDFLMPFLVPSRWFDYAKSKHLLDAEKVSFLLMELNQYASAASLYFSYVNDMALREFLLRSVKDFEKIESSTEYAFLLGIATEEEVKHARSQTQLARIRVTRVNELVIEELGAIRYALGLDPSSPIVFEDGDIGQLPFETGNVDDVIRLAKQRAPETAQLNSLAKAAKAEKWSKIFSFIDGGILSKALGGAFGGAFGGGGAGGGPSWTAVGQLNFGFAYFPSIRLTQHQQKEIEIRETELGLELGRTVSTLLGRLIDANRRYQFALAAEQNLQAVVESRRLAYEMGNEKFWAVFYAKNQALEASIERLKTRTEINALRVALQRALIEGEFGLIRGCPDPNLKLARKKGGFALFGWVKGLFGGGGDKFDQPDWLTVEKVCES